MDSNPTKKIGLASPAYKGAPKGIAQVTLENPEKPTPRPHWSYKSKKVRKQEILDRL
jgi:hypothetical protein